MRKVTQLWIYPIKSLGGVQVEKAEISSRGFLWDRRWMLVDAEGQFLSQRENAQMALLKTEIHDHHLVVYHRENPLDTIQIPFQSSGYHTGQVVVWDDTCPATYVSKEIDAWFSEKLGMDCHLVFMHEDSERKVDPRYAKEGEIVGFADGYPFLLIGEASLSDLNSRLEQAVPMDRFRPNIVFSGENAFEEDQMATFQLGNTTFQVVKPCARCVVTTINQENASKSAEPLKTLSSYRKEGNKVLFGQNCLHQGEGFIYLGEELKNITWKA